MIRSFNKKIDQILLQLQMQAKYKESILFTEPITK